MNSQTKREIVELKSLLSKFRNSKLTDNESERLKNIIGLKKYKHTIEQIENLKL